MAIRPYVCHGCAVKSIIRHGQRRFISDRLLQNRIGGSWSWKQQGQEIREGKRKSMLQVLEERGFINQIAGGRERLDEIMTNKRIGAYVGVDANAASIHLGHMIPLMVIFWMYLHGFHAITVIGASTAKIGDPTGRVSEREKMNKLDRKSNMVNMHLQLKSMWMHVDTLGRKYGYVWNKHWKRGLLNNNIWLNKVTMMEVLQELGGGLRMGSLLSRDSVKTRLDSQEGMAFAEFCYPFLQAWDWWHLYKSLDIQLQVGGADQFGNILTGLEAVKHAARNHPHNDVRIGEDVTDWEPMGLTTPLLKTSSGEKFGKSTGNAIWLSRDLTPSFDLYAYLVGTPDEDVERLLKLLTFIPLEDIEKLMTEHRAKPEDRVAQHQLALEVVELSQGPKVAIQTADEHSKRAGERRTIDISKHISAAFQNNASSATPSEGSSEDKTVPDWMDIQSPSLDRHAPQTNADNAPSTTVQFPQSLIETKPFASILLEAGLVNSRSEGHRLIVNHGAYVASRPGKLGGLAGGAGDTLSWTVITDTRPGAAENYVVWSGEEKEKGLLVLRVGKWKVKIIHILPDETFKEMQVLTEENPLPDRARVEGGSA